MRLVLTQRTSEIAMTDGPAVCSDLIYPVLAPVSCVQEIVFYEEGEPVTEGDPGDLKVSTPSAE